MLSTLRQSRRSRGQSLVEFALVLPILVILLFGTIQVGVTFGGYNGLINSVREAARYGSVCGTGAGCDTKTHDHLLQGIATGVFAYTAPKAVVSYCNYKDAANKYNLQIQVTGSVTGFVFIPFIGQILSWPASGVPLTSTEKFRVEGQPISAAMAAPDGTTVSCTP
jgi:Flp pilus assembly protein TadG